MQKTRYPIFYFFIILLVSGCNKKIEEVKVLKSTRKNEIGIITARNTALRIDPFIFSGRILLLKKGEIIKITGRSREKSWIGKSRDFWYMVELKNGMTGWIFGKNIKLISSKDNNKINSIVSDFFEGETKIVRKSLTGKWWSVNRFGDFTKHGIEFSNDSRYMSYRKARDPRVHEGEYEIDLHKNTINFDGNTTFGNMLQLVKRGQSYLLKKELKVGELVFKKISIDTSFDKDKAKKSKSDENKVK